MLNAEIFRRIRFRLLQFRWMPCMAARYFPTVTGCFLTWLLFVSCPKLRFTNNVVLQGEFPRYFFHSFGQSFERFLKLCWHSPVSFKITHIWMKICTRFNASPNVSRQIGIEVKYVAKNRCRENESRFMCPVDVSNKSYYFRCNYKLGRKYWRIIPLYVILQKLFSLPWVRLAFKINILYNTVWSAN
jgi:hypothetical protein